MKTMRRAISRNSCGEVPSRIRGAEQVPVVEIARCLVQESADGLEMQAAFGLSDIRNIKPFHQQMAAFRRPFLVEQPGLDHADSRRLEPSARKHVRQAAFSLLLTDQTSAGRGCLPRRGGPTRRVPSG